MPLRGDQPVVRTRQRGGRGGHHDVVAVAVPAGEFGVALRVLYGFISGELLCPRAQTLHLVGVDEG